MYKNILIIFNAALCFAISCAPPSHVRYVGKYELKSNNNYRSNKIERNSRNSQYVSRRNISNTRSNILYHAKRCLGVKYKMGGESLYGFDCSGLALYVYKKIGVGLPRSAKKQFYNGTKIGFKWAKPGDLIFFQTGRSRISHVAIYLGNYKFIHAPSSGKTVRVDSVKNNYWRKRYVGAVRYL